MNNQETGNQNVTSYSLRKIPFVNNSEQDIENSQETDKLKILELSNFMDEWEREVLFSENGFFSLKGKAVLNKSKEFLEELNQLVSSKLSELKFSNSAAETLAVKIKKLKTDSVKLRMEEYEHSQMKEWSFAVSEQAIDSAVRRAVLYKTNPNIIQTSWDNIITVLNRMAEKENWNQKTYNSKKRTLESKFYSAIIDSFIKDKNVNAVIYFEKYKDKLLEKEEYEKAVKYLKNNVIAYNWVQELISYNLSEKEQEIQINSVKDKEVQKSIREFILEWRTQKKNAETTAKETENSSNWQEIISEVKNNPQKAFLYIDSKQPESNRLLKKSYIKQIINTGCIKTQKKKFIELLKEFFEDFDKFQNKDISDYYESLSEKDMEFIKSLRSKNYEIVKSDYDYILKELETCSISAEEEKYIILKSVFELIEKNQLMFDIEKKNKLIKSVLERYQKNVRTKFHDKP